MAGKVTEWGSTLPDLKSHPMAEVLSPRARMHSEDVVESRQMSQMPMTMPRNSRRLFTTLDPKIGLVGGIRKRQARPVRL
jgi:hypothetical protein